MTDTLTPEQLEICKRVFKPKKYQLFKQGYKEYMVLTPHAEQSFVVKGNIKEVKAAAEQHYYETLAKNVNWEKLADVNTINVPRIPPFQEQHDPETGEWSQRLADATAFRGAMKDVIAQLNPDKTLKEI